MHSPSNDDLLQILDRHRQAYIRENRNDFANFLAKRIVALPKQKQDVLRIIKRYTDTYLGTTGDRRNMLILSFAGLDEVLFILLEWADRCLLFKKSSFREQHLCLLLILFITNHFLTRDAAKVNLESDIYIEVVGL